ncbi:WhiB family transcription factor [Mycobacterium phage Cepens]|uniref:WhiB family transcription factor n=1 Tax=Mycobacterium phage Taptic TaxID=1920305 RepID=A0A1J0ME54_9CAUD|nr:WhiB transcriptional factor [Mycobacterium phage Taptic]APD19285.1 WhiB family transcription factor [Mycobacterium phage Taptic]QBP32719.1 WhiB family transcription factor [Mycobacterium phage Cepens]
MTALQADEDDRTLPCQDDPDMWFPEGTTRAAQEQAAAAIMLCRSCPALQACSELTARIKPNVGVWAGFDYTGKSQYQRYRRQKQLKRMGATHV